MKVKNKCIIEYAGCGPRSTFQYNWSVERIDLSTISLCQTEVNVINQWSCIIWITVRRMKPFKANIVYASFFFFLTAMFVLEKRACEPIHWRDSKYLMQVKKLCISPGQIVMSFLLRWGSSKLGFIPCLYGVFCGQTLTCSQRSYHYTFKYQLCMT